MDFSRYLRTIFEWRKTVYIRGHLAALRTNLREESFFPELERKSYGKRLFENIAWYFRHGEINPYYNSYGFDVVGLRDSQRYLPYRRFRIERNNANLFLHTPYGYNRVCILRDKVLFSAYIAKTLGAQYVPGDVGRLTPEGMVMTWSAENITSTETLESFLKKFSGDLFIKKLTGECGEGCYLLESLSPGQTTLQVNGSSLSMEEFSRQTAGSEYIIQQRIPQHERLSSLNPSCVNTIRIITIVGKHSHTPRIFAHFLRLGVNTIMDNRATGGIAVLIDESGVLRGKGFGHHFVCDRHPTTGALLDGYALPFWPEVQELVIKAHNALKDIPSIGWDVAITPDGPILLEGNDNWELCGVQDTAGGIKSRWYELTNQ